ncbi:nuclear mitotic apparatus protein 1-like [Papaver somniferum]|uniref:nuclear mitotic apparatus protein 1-like n=1 Tax=Papaver somniferum TaxID=3469 RepID=UPI000E701738|nr:nuclear mitotic apparatus protein 1-like [Papaver somniferum]
MEVDIYALFGENEVLDVTDSFLDDLDQALLADPIDPDASFGSEMSLPQVSAAVGGEGAGGGQGLVPINFGAPSVPSNFSSGFPSSSAGPSDTPSVRLFSGGSESMAMMCSEKYALLSEDEHDRVLDSLDRDAHQRLVLSSNNLRIGLLAKARAAGRRAKAAEHEAQLLRTGLQLARDEALAFHQNKKDLEVTVKKLEEQLEDTLCRHGRERSELRLDVSSHQCKIDSLEQEKVLLQKDVDVHRNRIVELRHLLDKANKIAVKRSDDIKMLQDQKDELINWQCDHRPIVLQAEEDKETLKRLKRDYIALEKERDRHMLSCPQSEAAVTPSEARLISLDTETSRLEQNLATVLHENEEICKQKAELEKQLEKERSARRGLDRYLDELVSIHEEESAAARAEKAESLANLHAQYKVTITKACKAVVLRERQRVAAANIVVPPPVVDPVPETVQDAGIAEGEAEVEQEAPGDGQA